jgi:hypothetical protein
MQAKSGWLEGFVWLALGGTVLSGCRQGRVQGVWDRGDPVPGLLFPPCSAGEGARAQKAHAPICVGGEGHTAVRQRLLTGRSWPKTLDKTQSPPGVAGLPVALGQAFRAIIGTAGNEN